MQGGLKCIVNMTGLGSCFEESSHHRKPLTLSGKSTSEVMFNLNFLGSRFEDSSLHQKFFDFIREVEVRDNVYLTIFVD